MHVMDEASPELNVEEHKRLLRNLSLRRVAGRFTDKTTAGGTLHQVRQLTGKWRCLILSAVSPT